MLIQNGKLYTDDFLFHRGNLRIKDGIIDQVHTDPNTELLVQDGEDVIDASGCYVIPGLIDIHFHGCRGEDFCDGTRKALETLAWYEVQHGITGICPATLTLPVGQLKAVLANAAQFAKDQKRGRKDLSQMADLIGINMEGPFISHAKKGAQNEAYIIGCNADICHEFLEAGEGLVKLIGLAPEENPDSFRTYIEAVKDEVTVSLAHTNAGYGIAMEAFSLGASHAVHLFNAMPELTHREPGVVGAVADSPHVTAELICDGNHVHASVVRAAFDLVGEKRLVLISDSLRATGLGDGLIDLGGQTVRVEGTRATLAEEGNLAGSVTNLADCMRIAVKEMGIPLEKAVRCATFNPACVIGQQTRRGSLTRGKIGDVVLLRQEDLSLAGVIKSGVRVLSEPGFDKSSYHLSEGGVY